MEPVDNSRLEGFNIANGHWTDPGESSALVTLVTNICLKVRTGVGVSFKGAELIDGSQGIARGLGVGNLGEMEEEIGNNREIL